MRIVATAATVSSHDDHRPDLNANTPPPTRTPVGLHPTGVLLCRELRPTAGLSAMAARTALTSKGVRPGCLDRMRATRPPTCGAAKLLPVATVVAAVVPADRHVYAPRAPLHRRRRVVEEDLRVRDRVGRDREDRARRSTGSSGRARC